MYRILVDGELFCDSRIDDLAIINPVVNLKVNAAGSFKFIIPPEHPKNWLITKRKSIISVYIDSDTEPVFQGYCVEEEVDYYGQISIACEGELAYLNDSVLRQHHYERLTVRELLESYIASHNSQVDAWKRFEVGTVTVTDSNNSITCFTNMNPTMQEIKEDLVDDLGGYIRVRYANGKKYIDYLADSPHTSAQIIELGKNLIDYKSNIDSTDIATVIIPLGQRLEESAVEGLETRLDITSVNGGLDYVYSSSAVSNYGKISKVITWDSVTTADVLKSKAEQYLEDTQFENVVLTINAIDFGMISSSIDRFKLLDKIRVISDPHGMDRYFILSEQTLNLNNPENDSITLGIKEKYKLSVATYTLNQEAMKAIEQAPTINTIKSVVNNATNLITGADGGYLKIETNAAGQPEELKIQDALENPTKVWRWNLNGLGYSNDGGETYGTAMTMDGQIVADRISTGTMYADRIRGGQLNLGGQNNGNGQIHIFDENGVWCGALNNAGLTLFNPNNQTQVIINPAVGLVMRDADGNEYFGMMDVIKDHLPAITHSERGSFTKSDGSAYTGVTNQPLKRYRQVYEADVDRITFSNKRAYTVSGMYIYDFVYSHDRNIFPASSTKDSFQDMSEVNWNYYNNLTETTTVVVDIPERYRGKNAAVVDVIMEYNNPYTNDNQSVYSYQYLNTKQPSCYENASGTVLLSGDSIVDSQTGTIYGTTDLQGFSNGYGGKVLFDHHVTSTHANPMTDISDANKEQNVLCKNATFPTEFDDYNFTWEYDRTNLKVTITGYAYAGQINMNEFMQFRVSITA